MYELFDKYLIRTSGEQPQPAKATVIKFKTQATYYLSCLVSRRKFVFNSVVCRILLPHPVFTSSSKLTFHIYLMLHSQAGRLHSRRWLYVRLEEPT